jgi:hypothetical protein
MLSIQKNLVPFVVTDTSRRFFTTPASTRPCTILVIFQAWGQGTNTYPNPA